MRVSLAIVAAFALALIGLRAASRNYEARCAAWQAQRMECTSDACLDALESSRPHHCPTRKR